MLTTLIQKSKPPVIHNAFMIKEKKNEGETSAFTAKNIVVHLYSARNPAADSKPTQLSVNLRFMKLN